MTEAGAAPSWQPGPDRTWFVTGSSRGIGRALCERVLEDGERVVCTSRDLRDLDDLVARYPQRAVPIRLDVTDTGSATAAIQEAVDRTGGIDILVNNAGIGIVGALEEVEEDAVARAFDTNVLGAYRVTRAALPHMRARRSGHILNVSSALGLVAHAGYTFYCATKFALEGMTEALAQEVAPFGIRVTLLEPGSFRTAFRRGATAYYAPPLAPYAETLAPFRRHLAETDGKQPGDPRRGAMAIVAVVNTEKPPLRLPMGRSTVDRLRNKLKAMERELEEWLELSLSTSFEDAE